MKTYFNYESHIKSHDLQVAISLPNGVGPISGFGSGVINGNSLKIFPQPENSRDDIIAKDIRNRISNRYMVKSSQSEELPDTNFSVIARDGTLFTSDDQELNISSIQGIKGSINEVLVFAIHQPITEPIDNPIEFIACWNESSYDFYTIYKQLTDCYYPIQPDKRNIAINNPKIPSREEFYNMVEGACSYYKNNKQVAVLVGIYGTGVNAITKSKESFSIVPYGGEFPIKVPYTSTTDSELKSSISNLERQLSKIPAGTILVDYIDEKLKKLQEAFNERIRLAVLPIGSILLWEGDVIPDGWEEYTKASGRVVVGYQNGGVKINDSYELTSMGALYNPSNGNYDITITDKNLPRHRHGIGIGSGSQDNVSDANKSVVQNFDRRDVTLNGDVGSKYGTTFGVQSGSIVTSRNLVGDSFIQENDNSKLVLEKLPPAVTLKYIIKRK